MHISLKSAALSEHPPRGMGSSVPRKVRRSHERSTHHQYHLASSHTRCEKDKVSGLTKAYFIISILLSLIGMINPLDTRSDNSNKNQNFER